MAQYTVLNDEDLKVILAQYGIKNILSYKVLRGGSENTNYVINTQNKNLALTICEQKSIEKSTELATLLEHLDKNEFSTSKLIKTKEGNLTSVWKNKAVILKEFLEGDIMEDLSGNMLFSLGEQLAKLHQIKAPDYLPKTVSYGLERFDEVKMYAPESSFYAWLKNTQEYIEFYINDSLPKALIHSDIFYNNIIVSPDKKNATIMDFEEACYYYRVFDIGMMIIGTCNDGSSVNHSKVTSLLKGYQKQNQLLEIEKEALQAFAIYGATATAFWRHQNFNHVNFNSEKKDSYLEMKNLADNLMNIPKKEFKKCNKK